MAGQVIITESPVKYLFTSVGKETGTLAALLLSPPAYTFLHPPNPISSPLLHLSSFPSPARPPFLLRPDQHTLACQAKTACLAGDRGEGGEGGRDGGRYVRREGEARGKEKAR